MRKRTVIPLLIVLAAFAGLGFALYLRAKAPPEAARLLPECDAIVYVHLKPLRAATHFDEKPITHSPDFQRFIDATGILPERDLDEAAFALHRMADPRGPNGPVAYSEVLVGRFDGVRLGHYLESIASAKENYAEHVIYTVPVEGRQLRISQLGYDTVAASNMPTSEQIHSMVDRSRSSAMSQPGSSLLAQRYGEVPQLPLPAQAWGIGHIGLPFSQNGFVSVMGLQLPVPEDTDLVASLRYSGSVHLRIEEIASDPAAAQHTVETLQALLGIMHALGAEQLQVNTASANATAQILGSVTIEQRGDRAILNASATAEQLKAISSTMPETPLGSAASKR